MQDLTPGPLTRVPLAADSGRKVVRHAGKVDELGRELREAREIGVVGRDPERGPDGAARGEPDRLDVVVEGHPGAELATDERVPRDREGGLPGSGIAEAAGAERD